MLNIVKEKETLDKKQILCAVNILIKCFWGKQPKVWSMAELNILHNSESLVISDKSVEVCLGGRMISYR